MLSSKISHYFNIFAKLYFIIVINFWSEHMACKVIHLWKCRDIDSLPQNELDMPLPTFPFKLVGRYDARSWTHKKDQKLAFRLAQKYTQPIYPKRRFLKFIQPKPKLVIYTQLKITSHTLLTSNKVEFWELIFKPYHHTK